MKKIGILGGTFNPPHLMHLAIAKNALKEYGLDSIWLMPNGVPPHKEILVNSALTLHRKEMVSILIENEENIIFKDFEINKIFKNYTYLTVKFLKDKYKDYDFYYIIGEDSLDDFYTWKEYKRLSSMCKFIVCIRNSSNFMDFENKCNILSKEYKTLFLPLHMDRFDISSREIRLDIKNNNRNKLNKYLKKEVLSYIDYYNLYKEEKNKTYMDLDDIIISLKKRLKTSRFKHSISVMHTAANLSMRYGYSIKKAMYAGLLHDCAKNMTDEELLKICRENNVCISEAEYRLPYLLHGKAGAILAKKLYNIEDEEILHAISFHTTGTTNMSILDKIVFIADYIEPYRDKAKNLKEIRLRAYTDLDECLVFILRDTIDYLKENNIDLDKKTIETFEYYKKKTNCLSW